MFEIYLVFEVMGVFDKVKEVGFIEKYSVQFYVKFGKVLMFFYFVSEKDLDDECVFDSVRIWQVRCVEFDDLFFCYCVDVGVEILCGVSVCELIFDDGGQVVGLCFQLGDEKCEVCCKVVVDVMGQSVLIGWQFELLKVDYVFDYVLIFIYFCGVWCDEGWDEGVIFIFYIEEGRFWFWYILFFDDIVSVGVVGGFDYLVKDCEGCLYEIFFEEVECCVEIWCCFEGVV